MVRVGRKNSKHHSKSSVNVGDNDNEYNPTASHDIISVPGYSVLGYHQNLFLFDYSSTIICHNK